MSAMLTYALVGSLLRDWLAQRRRLLWFNRMMAAALVLTTGWMAWSASPVKHPLSRLRRCPLSLFGRGQHQWPAQVRPGVFAQVAGRLGLPAWGHDMAGMIHPMRQPLRRLPACFARRQRPVPAHGRAGRLLAWPGAVLNAAAE